jgi:hypothetical protein
MIEFFKRVQISVIILSIVLLVSVSLNAGAQEVDVKPITANVKMRNHGYVMGDFIHQQVNFTLTKGQVLESQYLPLEGYVKPWLDLAKVKFEQTGQQVELHLVWQIFATVEMTQALKTPEIILRTSGIKPQKIIVPAQTFYYSSALPQSVVDIKRRENFSLLMFHTSTPMIWALVFALLSIVFILIWLWLEDCMPWWPYSSGPMTRLARVLKGKTVIAEQDCIGIYHALNECAGQNIYANKLNSLFQRSPYLLPYQHEIVCFLRQATQHIYRHQVLGEMHSSVDVYSDFGSTSWVVGAAMAERIFLRNKRQYGVAMLSWSIVKTGHSKLISAISRT